MTRRTRVPAGWIASRTEDVIRLPQAAPVEVSRDICQGKCKSAAERLALVPIRREGITPPLEIRPEDPFGSTVSSRSVIGPKIGFSIECPVGNRKRAPQRYAQAMQDIGEILSEILEP